MYFFLYLVYGQRNAMVKFLFIHVKHFVLIIVACTAPQITFGWLNYIYCTELLIRSSLETICMVILYFFLDCTIHKGNSTSFKFFLYTEYREVYCSIKVNTALLWSFCSFVLHISTIRWSSIMTVILLWIPPGISAKSYSISRTKILKICCVNPSVCEMNKGSKQLSQRGQNQYDGKHSIH